MMKRTLALILTFAMMLGCIPAVGAADATENPYDYAMTKEELLENMNALEAYFKEVTGSDFGHASKKSSADLAWTESYALEGYFNMFRATGDVKYLKSLAQHFECLLGSRTDNNGNSSYGWDTARYSTKKIADAGFDKELNKDSIWKVSENGAKIYKEDEKQNRLELAPKGTISTSITNYTKDEVYEVTVDSVYDAGIEVVLKKKGTDEPLKTIENKDKLSVAPATPEKADVKYRTTTARYKLPADGVDVIVTVQNVGDKAAIIDNVQISQVSQFLCHDMLLCAPTMKFVKAVYEDARIQSLCYDEKRTYGDVAKEFLAIVEPIVNKWDKDWKEIPPDKGIYYWPSDESGEAGFVLPHNQYLQMANTMLPLYSVTKNEKYLDRATRMLKFLKSNVHTVEQDGRKFYHWNYMDRAFDTEEHKHDYTEDSSHGALELGAMFTGMEYGVVFSEEEDIPYLLNMIYQTLWNGSISDPKIYRAIEYDGGAGWHKDIPSESYIRDWVYLGKWDVNITHAMTAYFKKYGNPKQGHPAKYLAYSLAYRVLAGDEVGAVIPSGEFKDLSGYTWAKDSITYLADRGVIGGIGNEKFAPAKNITRADFVLMLMRALKLRGETDQKFADVSANSYYAEAVNIARANGIALGSDNKFNPNAPITRQDLMVILDRALKVKKIKLSSEKTSQFADAADIAGYASDSVKSLASAGIVGGTNGKILPNGLATRAECAVIFERTLKYKA